MILQNWWQDLSQQNTINCEKWMSRSLCVCVEHNYPPSQFKMWLCLSVCIFNFFFFFVVLALVDLIMVLSGSYFIVLLEHIYSTMKYENNRTTVNGYQHHLKNTISNPIFAKNHQNYNFLTIFYEIFNFIIIFLVSRFFVPKKQLRYFWGKKIKDFFTKNDQNLIKWHVVT